MGYSTGFNKVSGAAADTPQVTLLGALAPNLDLNIKVDASVSVKQDGPNAASIANTQKAQLAGSQQEIGRAKAAVCKMMESKQGEIQEATRAVGADPAAVFPDTKMAPDTGVELGLSALAGPKGQGTHGIKAIDNMSLVADIAADRTKPADEIKSEIKDTLIASCQAPDESAGFSGVIRDADESPLIETDTDWEAVFAACPDALDEIMYFDIDNPSAAFPEVAELNACEMAVDMAIAELTGIENYANEQTGFEVRADNVNAAPDSADLDEEAAYVSSYAIEMQEFPMLQFAGVGAMGFSALSEEERADIAERAMREELDREQAVAGFRNEPTTAFTMGVSAA